MAQLRVYSIYDRKAEAYMQPFFFSSDGQASRVFADMVNDPSHLVGRHPEDFDLYCCGVFEDVQGCVNGFDMARLVCTGNALVNARNAS